MKKVIILATLLMVIIGYYPSKAQKFISSSSVGYSGNIFHTGGNIGIGISTPVNKLHIDAGNGISSFTQFTNGTSSGKTTTDGSLFGIDASGNTIIKQQEVLSILFFTANAERIRILGNGNVGIGVTNPLYKLSVKGTIGCGEVKVEEVSTWADFVFNATYKLRTLKEVEQFIQVNKHLPEIPSQSEVKQNGIGLVEMNLKLLQKIEELTLYMIDLQNQINTVKSHNEMLIKDFEKLKKYDK